jgi:glycosyltransferase involved in cell wall biosynthesis
VAAIRAATGVTTSTPTLGAALSKWNRNVRVIPNAVDPFDFLVDGKANFARFNDDVITVGYAGSYSHLHDLKIVMPVLYEIGRLPGVRLEVFGYDPWQPLTGKEQETGVLTYQDLTYVSHGWELNLRRHYQRIGRIDIAIAPVLDTPFNRSKSAIKWMEHGIWATPMVVSDVNCYTETVRHGETAFVAKDTRDFRKYLTALVGSARLREEIGLAAQRDVLAHHTLTQRRALWREVLYGEVAS